MRLPTKTALRSGVENAATGFSSVGVNIVKWAGVSGGFAGKHILGADIEPDRNLAYAIGDWIEAYAKMLFPGDAALQHELGQKFATGIGVIAGFFFFAMASHSLRRLVQLAWRAARSARPARAGL